MKRQLSAQADESANHMMQALELAEQAFKQDEVPIGALIVGGTGQVIAAAYNQIEQQKSQLAHAELLAIDQATKITHDWRLEGCTLYVTVEPCAMCFAAIKLSRFDKLFFAASSPRFGYRLDNVASSKVYKSDLEVVPGLLADQAERIMKQFFQKQRKKKGEYKATRSRKNQSRSD